MTPGWTFFDRSFPLNHPSTSVYVITTAHTIQLQTNLGLWKPSSTSPTSYVQNVIDASSMEYHATESPSRDLLSPDLENSFFRSWALRTRNPDHSSTSSISPRTRSPITSPISPKSAVKPRRPGRPAIESRWTETNLPQIKGYSAQPDFHLDPASLNKRKLEVASQERRPTKTRVSVGSSVSKRSSKRSSNASSIGKRALKLIRRHAIKPSSPVAVRPPIRPLMSSRSWKRELSGHWLEIRIGKTPENVAKSPDTELPEIPHAPFPTPEASSYKPSQPRVTYTLEPPTPLSQQMQSQQMQRSTDSSSPETRPKKSIVDRTKQILGIKSSLNLSSSGRAQARRRSSADETTRILNRASSALTELIDKFRLTPPSTSTSTSNLSATSIALKSTRARRTLLRPGYRRSRPTGHSSSSSLRRVMFGNPPIPSPNLEDTYTASDAQQYFRVDLTDPNGPAYLPSEARRINTPPLPGKNSKLRGFFFDYNAPPEQQQQQQQQHQAEGTCFNIPKPTTTTTAPLPRRQLHYARPTTPRSPSARPQPHRSGNDDEDIEWFRVKVAIDEQQADEGARERAFELNVPEHLPSSPLCPRNPKHRSGGKGMCVYHGRNKTGTEGTEGTEEGGEEGVWR